MSRATLINAGLLLVLALLVAWLLGVHGGMPSVAEVSPARWGLALAAVSVYGLLCGFIGWRHRRRTESLPVAAGDDALLVAYAGQTGHAEQIARRTASSLDAAGVPVLLAPLDELTAARLRRLRRALFVVSTAGEGDAPDMAFRFVQKVMAGAVELPSLQYGLLALGDGSHEGYCRFGRRLDAWLQHGGAQPLFGRVEVDSGDAGALRHWQYQLGVIAGHADLPDWQVPAYEDWRLVERRLLNPGSAGAPCYHVALEPAAAGATVRWQAGDVAEIGPRNAPEAVRQWLQAVGWEADVAVVHEGQQRSLAELLARSRLPELSAMAASPTPQELAGSLQLLPHREYSIASIPSDGQVQLLIRQLRLPDGTLGVGGGWLTAHAPVGGPVALRIRSNAAFHPPPDARPLILIGNGTGLAGLRALLKARIEAGRHANWLVFGERNAAHDFYYREELQQWQVSGALERLDAVFSRDGGRRLYVQDRLREQAPRLREWVARGAAIYVCGSREGMAAGVHAALHEALGVAAVENLAAEGRYRRDVY